MTATQLILNEREAKRAASALGRMDELSSPAEIVKTAQLGFSAEIIELHAGAVQDARKALETSLASFKLIQAGKYESIAAEWQYDPGIVLIIARIAHGLSQAGLAGKLGMKEQQIQRYEAERYRSISLQNFRRIAGILGVDIRASLRGNLDRWLTETSSPTQPALSEHQFRTVLAHAKKNQWFNNIDDEALQRKKIVEFISENHSKFDSVGLLRTGLNTIDLQDDALLIAWRARVAERAELVCNKLENVFDFLDISWLQKFVRLSSLENGPLEAIRMAADKGIVIIIEPQLPGLTLDGAAFLLNGIPVIGVTIRHDRVDNFWFTLMHEFGHIFLHQHRGLVSGFFDEELESTKNSELEKQADQFASSVLIPTERWRVSSARIARSPGPIEQFAKQVGIHPAIVFGRLRRERNDYRIFSNKVGSGEVRNQFYLQ